MRNFRNRIDMIDTYPFIACRKRPRGTAIDWQLRFSSKKHFKKQRMKKYGNNTWERVITRLLFENDQNGSPRTP